MEKTWRWFGKNDVITLEMLRQIGVEGIVTAPYDVPNGEVWTPEVIGDLKAYIERSGLHWSVVESLPVPEAVKFGDATRDRWIENFKISLAHLGKSGIKTVCYNFMPAIDWVRTDLHKKLADGTYTLYFDKIQFVCFDCMILQREGAEKDYTTGELEKARLLFDEMTKDEIAALTDAIVVKTQTFIHRKISAGNIDPLQAFREQLELYKGVNKTQLRENLKYFLERVIPVAEEYGVTLCIHPDDPPFPIFGLPRIVTGEKDIEWILSAVDSPANGLTFCAGSLSESVQNDTPALAGKFADKIGFAHLRSTEVFRDGGFMEVPHLEGRGKLIEVIRILEKQRPHIPMRVDHGRLMLDDVEKQQYNPGYSFYGRMFALGQLDGIMAVVRNEFDG